MKTSLSARRKAIAGVLLAVVCLTSGIIPAAYGNLIRNGSFEAVPGTGRSPVNYYGQGRLPSEWLQGNDNTDNADTYTYSPNNDVSTVYGLLPGAFGNFNGKAAQDGIRWVAGWSLVPETFGQLLTTTLSAGQAYTLSGYLLQSEVHLLGGGFEIYLTTGRTDPLGSGVLLGQLSPTTGTSSWVERSFTFTAPANSGALPFLAFVPIGPGGDGAYTALDNVDLSLAAVPEPSTIIAGALLLLPFGVTTLRALRKHRSL